MPGGTPFILQKQIILRLSILKLFIEQDVCQAELEDARRYARYTAQTDHPTLEFTDQFICVDLVTYPDCIGQAEHEEAV